MPACVFTGYGNGSRLRNPKPSMNFEDFELIWSRQLVVGRPVSAELVRDALVQEVRQRSRRVRRIMGVAVFVFVVGWAAALVMHYTGIKPFTAQDLGYLA